MRSGPFLNFFACRLLSPHPLPLQLIFDISSIRANMRSFWSTVALAAIIRCAVADNVFVRPGPMGNETDFSKNPRYEVGDEIDAQFRTDEPETDLLVWMKYPNLPADAPGRYLVQYRKCMHPGIRLQCGLTNSYADNEPAHNITWKVTLEGLNLTTIPEKDEVTLQFMLYKSNQTQFYIAASDFFNITRPEQPTSTTTSQAPTSTSSQSSASKATSYGGPPPSRSDGSKSNGSSKKSLSSGAVAGIAVGATLAGVAILGAIGLFVWKRHRKNQLSKKDESTGLMGGSDTGKPSGAYLDNHKAELAAETKHGAAPMPPKAELPGTLPTTIQADNSQAQFGGQYFDHTQYAQNIEGIHEAP